MIPLIFRTSNTISQFSFLKWPFKDGIGCLCVSRWAPACGLTWQRPLIQKKKKIHTKLLSSNAYSPSFFFFQKIKSELFHKMILLWWLVLRNHRNTCDFEQKYCHIIQNEMNSLLFSFFSPQNRLWLNTFSKESFLNDS